MPQILKKMIKKLLSLSLVIASLSGFSQEVAETVETVKETVTSEIVETVKETVMSKEVKAESTATTFYLINNAEKKAPKADQLDPYLTKDGVARVENWTKVLGSVKIDAIYALNTISAKQTAQIIGEAQKAGIYELETENMYNDAFKYNTNSKNILIVGDNATTTKFSNTVLGTEKYSLAEGADYGLLYIITIDGDSKTSVVLDIN